MKLNKTKIKINNSSEGETIETKIRRIMNNKEPISDTTVPLTYTDREDGVLPAFDIRTDRWDIAIEAMDKVSMSAKAKREEALKKSKEGDPSKPIEGKA